MYQPKRQRKDKGRQFPRMFLIMLALMSAMFLTAGVVHAANVSWNNPTGGNWNTGTVPGATDDVFITLDGTYTVTLNGSKSINSLTIGGATGVQTLLIQGNSANGNATLTSASDCTNGGTITLDSIDIVMPSSLVVSAGILTNQSGGFINVNPGTGGSRTISANLTNDGTVNINASTELSKTDGVTINNSAFNIATDASLTFGTRGVFNQDSGTLDIDGSFTMVYDDTLNFNDGTITGTPLLAKSTLNLASTAITPLSVTFQNISNLSGNIVAGQSILIQACAAVGGAILTTASGFTNEGTITLDSIDIVMPSSLVVPGILTNQSGGVIDVNPGTGGSRTISAELNNQGAVNIGTTATLSSSSADHANSGIINITGGNLILNQSGATPSFINTGTIDVGATRIFDINSGTFFNQSPGDIIGGGTVNINSATFFGVGAIVADVNNISSQINPGPAASTPGILNITGDYSQNSSDALNIEVGGTNPGTGFDQLNISALATLAGGLNISLINGFVPTFCNRFQIITYGSYSSDFNSVTGLDLGGGLFFRRDVTLTAQTLVTCTDTTMVNIYPTDVNVTEGGTFAVYCLHLTTQPTADVIVTVSPDTQVTVSDTTLIFPLANWTEENIVTVMAVDDTVFEGPHTGIITHSVSSADASYDGSAMPDVTANITDNDTPPVANNDAYSVDEDTTLNVVAPGVLDNNTDADGDSLTAIEVSSPSNGTLTLNANGSFTYTPNANYNGDGRNTNGERVASGMYFYTFQAGGFTKSRKLLITR